MVLASFLSFHLASPSVDICSLIKHLCNLLLAPFKSNVSQTFPPPPPPPPPDNKLVYFRNLPTVRGTPAYLADQHTASHAQEDQDACGKYSSSHPTLTSDIFTIYCPHGVCCGFEVMRSHILRYYQLSSSMTTAASYISISSIDICPYL